MSILFICEEFNFSKIYIYVKILKHIFLRITCTLKLQMRTFSIFSVLNKQKASYKIVLEQQFVELIFL